MEQGKIFTKGILCAIAGVALLLGFAFRNGKTTKYHPSQQFYPTDISVSQEQHDVTGAAKWWFDRVKDPRTGQLDVNEMLRMQKLSNQTFSFARNSNPSSASSVQWNELGPDNVGGRTRTILFDNQDPTHQHMFAAGVSGGIFESTNAGNNWHRCAGFFSTSGVTITVVTLAQASNGDLYAGTGEGDFYSLFGYGAGGFTGGGIYKSTDDGVTWNVLPATQPAIQNSTVAAWIAINKIACDPVDSNLIYVGMNKGFRESTDGGVTWFTPTGIPTTASPSTDVAVASNGNVVAIVNTKPWLSTDGGQTFSNVGTAANGFSNSVLGRTTVAIAPSDPNYVYCFCADTYGALFGVFVSVNGGSAWTQVCGAGNSLFDPFSTGVDYQGTFDNIVAVDPINPQRAIFGGVQLWEWDMISNNPPAGQWTQIASEFPETVSNHTYVGEDKHAIVFQPGSPSVFYIGCDRGIFRTTDNGNTYAAVNQGYNVTQCYAVAFDYQSTNKNIVLTGTQDNGSQFIDGSGNTPMSARKLSFDDDGDNCALSYLNPNAIFYTKEYGYLYRSSDYGQNFTVAYSSNVGFPSTPNPSFASFVTPISLWESGNDLLSGDTISIPNNQVQQNLSVTNGDSAHYAGTLSSSYPIANPSGTFILDSVMFVAGPDTIHSDFAGNLSGDGTGTVFPNGNYSLTFNTTPPANRMIKAFFYLQYGAGTVFTVNSNVYGKTLDYTSTLVDNPHDTLKVQDVIQSHLAVGFSGDDGMWITRRAIDFNSATPWIKIGGALSLPKAFSGITTCLVWSSDGNYLFAGTDNGNVYRFSNVGMVTDTLNGNAEFGSLVNPNCVVTCTLIGNFPSRYITAIDVDPNNTNQVIVSIGNYGYTDYVYYSSTATTATSSAGTFTNATGNLLTMGACPAYSISFDKYANGRALVGTEHGIFETANISNITPTWIPAMNGLDNVSVNQIVQQRFDPWLVPNSGCFYIATHGRGVWRDDSSWQMPTGISNPSNISQNNPTENHDLKIFPNPVVDNSNLQFKLAKAGNVTVRIFDLSGKIVATREYENLNAGTNTIGFDTGEMAKGTYVVVVMQEEKRIGISRFIKMN